MRAPVLGLLLLASAGCGGATAADSTSAEQTATAQVQHDPLVRLIGVEGASRISVRAIEPVPRAASAVGGSEEQSIALYAATRVAITADGDGAPLSEILCRLGEVAPIRIIIDWQVAQDARETIVNDMEFEGTLDAALRLLTQGCGLLPIFGADQVLITRPEYAQVATDERWYSIAPELVAAMSSFIPPTIQLVGPDSIAEEDIGWGCEALEPVLPYVEGDFAGFVRSAVEPDCWSIRGFSMEQVGGGLRVRCSARIQLEVESFLESLAQWPRAGQDAERPHEN